MKVIVGLGNPGRRYSGTRHSVGFEVLDALAERLGVRLRISLRFNARLGRVVPADGHDLLLMKPQTYMNNSGVAVAAVLRYHRLGLADAIVVVDDADLELGRLRIRAKGSSGGHRGLESIAGHAGGEGFVRVRFGIGRGPSNEDLAARVLSRFSKEEREKVDNAVKRAADAVFCIVQSGVECAMNRFNAGSGDGEGG